MSQMQPSSGSSSLTTEDWETITDCFEQDSPQQRTTMLKEAVKSLVSEGKGQALQHEFQTISSEIQGYVKEYQTS